MPKVENITLHISRDSLRTPSSGANSSPACKPTLFLPIESKRSVSYVAAPVDRTLSTESTDTSLSPSTDRFPGRLSFSTKSLDRPSSAPLPGGRATRIEPNRRKSVSWAAVSEVRVIGLPDSSLKDGFIGENCVEKFVKKLRRSPKHADTIYVYQSAPWADFDDQNELNAYLPLSSEPSFVECDNISPILCESSN